MSTRKRSDEDFDREIRAHLELEAARLVEDGMAPDDAPAAARRSFGNVTAAKERFYEAGRLLWLDHLVQDVRCACRNMRRAPVAAIVAIASLAAGIGATTVTLTVRNVVFHKPPPLYQHPEELSRVQVGRPDRPIMRLGSPVPAALYLTWRDRFGSTIVASMAPRGVRDVRTQDRTETAPVRAITPGFFSVLGVTAELGHTDLGSTPGRDDVATAVISYRLWQRLFDGRSDVIGRVVWIEKQPHTIVGVLPERFWFADMNSPIWTRLDPETLAPEESLEVIIRRPSGTTPAMLDAQLQTGLADYVQRLPTGQRDLRLRLSGIEGTPIGNQVAIVLPYLLGMSVLLTLLIACANVAILMIAQWTAREHEIAIRASIGASRGRIVRSLLTESVLAAAIGGALGVCATFALRGWIVRRGGADVVFFDLSIDPGILIKTAVIALVTGVVVGIAPALYETRRLHTNPLRTMAGSDRVRQRWRNALVVLEITITVALLVETAAMIDGYMRARSARLGFPTRPLMSARVENPHGVPTLQVLDVLHHVSGVAAAAASTGFLAANGQQLRVSADATGSDAVISDRALIGEGFFSTLGVEMKAGRPFAKYDAAARVAIVNDTLAGRLFHGRDPLGNPSTRTEPGSLRAGRIWIAEVPYDVVGVVADYTVNPLRYPEFEARVFLPLPDQSKELTRLSFLVRANGDPAPLTQTIRREVRDALTGTVVTNAFTVDQIFNVMGQEILVGTAPLFPLIAIGMLLTVAGIYGVLTFAITRRSRELALRVAVGASGRDLIALMSAQSLKLVAVGSAAGIAATFGLSRLVRAGGGAGSLWDPGVQAFVIPVLIVVAIGALATWIPSRRALKINPADLLRTT